MWNMGTFNDPCFLSEIPGCCWPNQWKIPTAPRFVGRNPCSWSQKKQFLIYSKPNKTHIVLNFWLHIPFLTLTYFTIPPTNIDPARSWGWDDYLPLKTCCCQGQSVTWRYLKFLGGWYVRISNGQLQIIVAGESPGGISNIYPGDL